MLYKLENGYLKSPKNPLNVDGKNYSNPTRETLKALGYKELDLAQPEPVEGYYWQPKYIDAGLKITAEWELVKDELET